MADVFAVLARKPWVEGAIHPQSKLWGSGLPQIWFVSICTHAISSILGLVVSTNIQTTGHSLGNCVN